MARPVRIEFAGAMYHITSRGNARRDIFESDEDRKAFLDYLSRACHRYSWLCHAYCLMADHYHLLVETKTASLSKGMKYINGAYTQQFNRNNGWGGRVFQGRFKGILVEKKPYFLELSRYIVLNPVRAGMARSASEWRWSSYRATAGSVKPIEGLYSAEILKCFDENESRAQAGYRQFVTQGKDRESPWPALKKQIFLGSDDFVSEMQNKINLSSSQSDKSKQQGQVPLRSLGDYEKSCANRDEAMAEAYNSGEFTLKQVGDYFSVSAATVSRIARERDKR